MQQVSIHCDHCGADLTGESRRHAIEFVGGPDRHREPLDLCCNCHNALRAWLANRSNAEKEPNVAPVPSR